jgi:hypothetical protein
MTGDTSARREWYDEDPFPDVPPPVNTFAVQQGRFVGKTFAFEKITQGLQAAGFIMGSSLHGVVVAFNQFGKAVLHSDAQVPENESVRDRALRLRKQGHSMSSDHARLDYRVRRNL